MQGAIRIRARVCRPAALLVLIVACTFWAASTRPAHAATIIGDCGWSGLTVPFLGFGDPNVYFQAPGGDFESAMTGWTLAGDAQVMPGNESYQVGGASDNRSLSLPTTSSSATSAKLCVTALSPSFRMFVRVIGRNGHTDGQLAIYLNYTDKNGNPKQVKIAALKATTSWSLGQPVSFAQYLSDAFKRDGLAQISFTIKPNDDHGSWQIDDLYVDPVKIP